MRILLGLFLFLTAMGAWSAPPHLDLDLHLDPATRAFSATAVVSGVSNLHELALDPALRVTRLEVDGQPVGVPPPQVAGGLNHYRIDSAGHSLYRLTLGYQGSLAPLVQADQRQVLGRMPPMADPDGSYLPGGSGWYPDPGQLFTYHLRLSLPAGQKGLVPGELTHEAESRQGYSAEFDFPHPAEGIELMAGPYQVSERILTLPRGQRIRLRTWFHPELADLAGAYLDDSARYIERYSRLIGAYPFASFSIVSSPLPTGFGMPSLTYLGWQVLRLPFIRATSLGHEILHNWWGNGVYPDYDRGNWSEGLTTFMADYAYKEDQSEAAARETRLEWLRDLVAVPPSEDIALKDFVARHHGISSIIGYDKAAMVFFMLRDLIGVKAFDQGVRLLWQDKRFQTASWADLEEAFTRASHRGLGLFFRQWIVRPGAPKITISGAEQHGAMLTLELKQSGDYSLRVPVRLRVDASQTDDRWIDLTGHEASTRLAVRGRVQSVELDPDYRLWRRVEPALFPAILREVFVAPQTGIVVVDEDKALRNAAWSLAGRLLDAQPIEVADRAYGLPGQGAMLIMGTTVAVDAWLARHGLAPRPNGLDGNGTAQVWAGRDRDGRPYAVVSSRDTAGLQALERALPHYGRQSWLVFEGPRVKAKGVWPPSVEQTMVKP
jgi:aminopeptidase N